MDRGDAARPLTRAAILLGVAAVYVAAGKLGLHFAIVHASATPVWPPAGLALAALLLLGRDGWPAILLGAFVVNATTAGSAATSLGIAAGNTLESVIGAALVARWARGAVAFERARDIFVFIAVAGVVPAVAATVGVLSLALGGYAAWSRFAAIWITWWLGDAGGILVVAPPLLLWATRPGLTGLGRRWAEALLVLAATAATGLVAFGGYLPPAAQSAPIAFVCIPPLLWAAFRFGAREAATLIAVLAAIAVAGTLAGHGAFARETPNVALLLLQAFLATMAVAVLPVAALVWERQRADAAVRESEERVRLAVESGRLGTWHWVLATDAVTWSPSLERLHGLAPGTFAGTLAAFEADVHPDDRARVEAAIRHALATGEHRLEYRIVRPDGAVRWLEARGTVLYDRARRPERMLGVCMDVTERKDAEARAEFLGELARSLTSSLDLDTVLQRIVDGARALCHSDNAAIFLWDAGTGAMRPRYRGGPPLDAYGALRIRPGEGLGGEVMLTRRPVRTRHYATDPRVPAALRPLAEVTSSVAVMVVPILLGDEVTGLLYISNHTARELTDDDEHVCVRLAEQAAVAIRNAHLFAEQEAARAEAEAANRAKDEFLAMLGHELRNPLAAIAGAVEVLRLEGLPAEAAAHARAVVERQSRHLGRLVDDLLDVSRVMSGKIELRPAPLDLADLVGRAVDVLRASPRGRERQVTVEAAPVWTRADATRLEQVVTNLLDNAAKYTPAGGAVAVTVHEDGGEAVLVVRDDGVGIAPDLLPRVFELFVQGDHSLHRAEGGLGLGLTLVRQLVELHGGAVAAASGGHGRGATFTVRLPHARPRRRRQGRRRPPPARAGASSSSRTTTTRARCSACSCAARATRCTRPPTARRAWRPRSASGRTWR